jgi:hypothetical protein
MNACALPEELAGELPPRHMLRAVALAVSALAGEPPTRHMLRACALSESRGRATASTHAVRARKTAGIGVERCLGSPNANGDGG